MNRRLLPLNSLRAFEATGVHLSFTRAADSLSVTQSAVSRHVINLENILGIKLFERRHHQLILTEQGEALLPVVTGSLDSLERVMTDIIVADGTVNLRVAFPPTFAQRLAVPIMTGFQNDFPDIALHLETPAHVEDIRKENYDMAIVYTTPKVTENILDLLWQEQVTPICHPDLIKDCDPSAPQDFLQNQNLIHVKVGENKYLTWDKWLKDVKIPMNAQAGTVFDTAALAIQYAQSGAGVALTDPKIFQKELDAGTLVAPFSHLTHESGYGYYLICRPEDVESGAIHNLRRWLIQNFGAGM